MFNNWLSQFLKIWQLVICTGISPLQPAMWRMGWLSQWADAGEAANMFAGAHLGHHGPAASLLGCGLAHGV